MNFETRLKKKEQMLEKCFELFVEQGLENTSLNDLATHCQTHKSSMYVYFSSKDEIVIESAKMYMTNLNNLLRDEFKTPHKCLRNAFERCFDCIKSNAYRLRFIYQVLSSPKYGEESRLYLEEIRLSFSNCSKIISDLYEVDHQKINPLFLLFTSVIHDYCLWNDSPLASEKLNYIYSKVSELENSEN